jgi:hypothetical protein
MDVVIAELIRYGGLFCKLKLEYLSNKCWK